MARILVIEDDPQSARLVARVLEREGHEVTTASAGLAGLKIASQGRVDLILLDLNLPDLSGHTVAALIHRIPGHIPVVVVTASGDEATERRVLTSGCNGFISKPIDTHTFPAQLSTFLNDPDSVMRPACSAEAAENRALAPPEDRTADGG